MAVPYTVIIMVIGGHAIATTQLLSQHIRPGRTIAESIKDGIDYGRNPFKTRDGDLVLSYMCDSETAEAEFLLSKAQYYAITGRRQKKENDVLYYQIRQSFKAGEIDHDTALKVGYDLAMRWTKGKHAFIVVSHTDRPNPHIHPCLLQFHRPRLQKEIPRLQRLCPCFAAALGSDLL